MEYTPSRFVDNLPYSQNEKWFCVHGGLLSQQAGWKLYIPYTPDCAFDVIAILLPYLSSKRITFKYLRDRSAIAALNSGDCGYSQIGKCFVIYMPSVDQELIADLINMLKGRIESYPRPPYLARLASDPPIFYRFGDYRARPGAENWRQRHTVEDRVIELSCAEEAPSPAFPKISLQALLLKYPVVDVISQQGKGGVFVGLDLGSQHYREVILKLGYRHGNETIKGVDGMALIRNEESALRYLQSSPLRNVRTPNVLAAAEGEDSYAIVLERIDGCNGRNCLNTLEVKLIIRVLEGIKALHSAGILWCDAKIDNVIFSEYGEINFIDFETSTLKSSRDVNCLRTFAFAGHSQFMQSVTCLEEMHFLASILFDAACDNQRELDLHDMARRHYADDVRSYCSAMLRKYL